MQLIRGYRHLKPQHQGCVATIGNFDGVHLGHQAVFKALLKKSAAFNLPAIVITFEPQSKEFFTPDKAPARITRLREKLDAIEKNQISRVLLLDFNQNLAQLSATDFIQKILVDALAIKYLYVGDDFQFGKNRQGNFQLLQDFGQQYDFDVASLATIKHNEQRISSSIIRQSLSAGDLTAAKELLGRAYRICGRVAHGDKRGRTIGFPTANIDLKKRISPLKGVYAVRVRGLSEKIILGVANIGVRPTVSGRPKHLLEVHLFDFKEDIYGKHLNIEFVERIRDEQKFDSFEQLKQQIKHDSAMARRLLMTDKELNS